MLDENLLTFRWRTSADQQTFAENCLFRHYQPCVQCCSNGTDDFTGRGNHYVSRGEWLSFTISNTSPFYCYPSPNESQHLNYLISGWMAVLYTMTRLVIELFFFLNVLEDMSPFLGATDTPVSDFWWRPLWVSKPKWVLPHSSVCVTLMLVCFIPCMKLNPLVRHLLA